MKCLRMQTEQEMKEECLYLGFASLQPVLQISFFLPSLHSWQLLMTFFQMYLPSALEIGTVLSMQKSPLVVGKTVIGLVFNFFSAAGF